MMSSGEEDNDDLPRSSSASRITSVILFGNIDENGELTDDIFDDECRRHLDSLQPHLSSIIPFEDLIEDDDDDDSSQQRQSDNDKRLSDDDDGKGMNV